MLELLPIALHAVAAEVGMVDTPPSYVPSYPSFPTSQGGALVVGAVAAVAAVAAPLPEL